MYIYKGLIVIRKQKETAKHTDAYTKIKTLSITPKYKYYVHEHEMNISLLYSKSYIHNGNNVIFTS